MEEIIIKGITICIRDGHKYRRYNATDRLDGGFNLVCMIEGCTTTCVIEEYCYKHYKLLPDNEKEKILNERIEKLKKEYPSMVTNNQLIDGITIYKFGDTKYRLNCVGAWRKVCPFLNCISTKIQADGYCCVHKNGSDPNSTARIKEKELVRDSRAGSMKITHMIGDDTEKWVFNIMGLFDTIHSVEQIGSAANSVDIIYKLKGEEEVYRGIQIKTLHQDKNGAYSMTIQQSYSDDTLIVGVNKNRNLFVVCFRGDVKADHIAISADCNKDSKHRAITYYKKYDFLEILEKSLSKSCIYDKDNLAPTALQESNSLARLKTHCDAQHLIFKRNIILSSPIDIFINDYYIQSKASTRYTISKIFCQFMLCRRDGRKKGKEVSRPYADKDRIDFFIFELIDYPNNFYIIPIDKLIKKGYILTDNQPGKKNIYLPIIGYTKYHWAKKYLNNFEQLKVKIFDSPIQRFD